MAVPGLGRVAFHQILPAFGKSKLWKPVALVSGDPARARKIAGQYGIRNSSVYSYESYESLAQKTEVKVIYILGVCAFT